ncbi:MAG: hypothetical protein QOH79_2615 [Acidimicrobiaceae bacterium]
MFMPVLAVAPAFTTCAVVVVVLAVQPLPAPDPQPEPCADETLANVSVITTAKNAPARSLRAINPVIRTVLSLPKTRL